MHKCKGCARVLQKGEVEYCPACASSQSHKSKKIIEVVGLILVSVVGIALAFKGKE